MQDTNNLGCGKCCFASVQNNPEKTDLFLFFFAAIGFLEKYGWFIVLAILVVLVIYEKLKPQIHKWWNHFEDYSNKKTDGKWLAS